MSSIFCCSSISPYRPQCLDHEPKFKAFMQWTDMQRVPGDGSSFISTAPYAVQLVRQINYGPQESVRYFLPSSGGSDFKEVTESDLLRWNFEKLNSYKNFRCGKHNKFFEVNLYQKNLKNNHHWRANLGRPSRDIDLAYRQKELKAESANEVDKSKEIKDKAKENELPKVQNDSSTMTFNICGAANLPHEGEDMARKETGTSAQLNIKTLKSYLRLLLPRVGKSLGSSGLLYLLCLDWVNAELDLGLELEAQWDAELTSSNIIVFLCDSIDFAPGDDEIDLGDMEKLVVSAMNHIKSTKLSQAPGRARFREIIDAVIKDGHHINWVSKRTGDFIFMFESGPSEIFLEHLRGREAKMLRDPRSQKTNVFHELAKKNDHVEKEFVPWKDDPSDESFESPTFGNYEYSYDSDENDMDLTACDKECGYCGHCSY